MANRTPAQLFAEGLPIAQALRADSRATRVLLLAELARTWRAVKVGEAKTWATQEDLQDAVDDVLEIFPTLKVEEVLRVLRDIRQGRIKLFGRLDTPTLVEALRTYEDQHTTTYREAAHRQPPTVETAAIDTTPEPGTMTVAEGLRRIAQELPRRRKLLAELPPTGTLTADEVQTLSAAQDEARRRIAKNNSNNPPQ